jgi:hypothetical protein
VHHSGHSDELEILRLLERDVLEHRQARGVSRELAIADAFARGACSTSPLCGRQEAGSTFQRLAAAVVAAVASGRSGGANHAGAPAPRSSCRSPARRMVCDHRGNGRTRAVEGDMYEVEPEREPKCFSQKMAG